MAMVPRVNFSQLSRHLDLSRLSWFQLTCLLGGSAVAIWKLTNSWSVWRRNARILALIKKKRVQRDEAVRKLKTELSTSDTKVLEKRRWIVSLPARELAGKLQNEELKPLEVLEAFQSAALLAHEKTNCVAQFIIEARDWCMQLEQQYEGRDDKPPLFGLPFSVKESIGVKGYDATAGLSRFLFEPLQEDGALVARLRQLGAIPFALTNVPQTLLSFNCSNPIYGVTSNPKNPKRTCGGSTGGEGALLAFRGSAFGLGSDLAGSIRVPAHFCGVTSIKPSITRLSQLGGRKVFVGRSVVGGCFGPFAADVDTLVMFFEEVLHEKFFALDTYIAPIPFRRNLYENEKKLTIGYYDYDGVMDAVPACKRAVQIAKGILEKRGHRLVQFKPPNVDKLFAISSSKPCLRTIPFPLLPYVQLTSTCEARDIFKSILDGSYISELLFIDAGFNYHSEISKDLVDESLADTAWWYSLPIWTRRLVATASSAVGSKKVGEFMGSFTTSTRDLGATLSLTFQYKTQFNTEWRRLGLDAVICPPGASVAMPHGLPNKALPAFMYTLLYNIMDYPAGIVPVTHVTVEDERKTSLEHKANEYFSKLVHEANKEGSVGLPVGVQCVASTYNEEVVLRVMKEIEDGVKKAK